MFTTLRRTPAARILDDGRAFWDYVNSVQRPMRTPKGYASEVEERLDLELATKLKVILEGTIGPEEGPSPVQMQNWDWNDDRSRAVYVLKFAFQPRLIEEVENLLVGEFEGFQVLILVYESWGEFWGGVAIARGRLGIQRNIFENFVFAA